MNVYISADIEGVGCVVRSEHSNVEGREYAFARKQMTAEVNAAAQGAFAAGAERVVVADAHNVGLNLIPDELDERLDLIMGSPRPYSMMEGVDQGFDAVMFVGYHAMAGVEHGIINHVFRGRIARLALNGLIVGETGLNALLAGHYNVPAVFLSGDETTCREAEALMPGVKTAAVKKAIGMYAGLCMHPKRAVELIRRTAEEGVSELSSRAPLVLPGDDGVFMEIDCTTASTADRACRIPGTERTGGASLTYRAKDIPEAYRAFCAICDLAGLTHFI